MTRKEVHRRRRKRLIEGEKVRIPKVNHEA